MRISYREHAGLVQLKVDISKKHEQIAKINATHTDYMINLLHCAKVSPSNYPAGDSEFQMLYLNRPHVLSPSQYFDELNSKTMVDGIKLNWDSLSSKSASPLPTLIKCKEYRTQKSGWSVLMRPVVASKQECLNCHNSKKIGDTLGVMVYAVRAPKGESQKKISLR